MRKSWAVAGIGVLGIALAGCVPPGFACTTIGYSSTAFIELEEPRRGVQLELCDGEGCRPGPAMAATEIQPATTTPLPAARDTGVMSIIGDGVTGWTADFLGGQPTIGWRLLDASGVELAQGTADADWKRVGGTAQCGGPREAMITLSL